MREDSGQDVFCAALKHFVAASPGIKSFSLGGPACIDGSLFWPPISQAACNGWTNTEDVMLDLSADRPDGGWYRDKHPDIPLDSPSKQEL